MIQVILWKEWRELRKERTLLLSTVLPPLLLAIMPVAIMYTLRSTPDEDTAQLGIALADPSLAGLTMAEVGQAVLGKQFGLLLLLMPAIVPGIIAAYSIVGEKNGRTLEPLLATPVSSWTLLLAKSLAALIPALAATWGAALIFAAGVGAVALTPRVLAAVLTPAWWTAIVLCAPPLAMIVIAASVAVSSRVSDPRSAQQLTAVLIVPLMMLFFAQLAGVVVLSVPLALGVALALSLAAAGALWAATRIFQRDTILTRWK